MITLGPFRGALHILVYGNPEKFELALCQKLIAVQFFPNYYSLEAFLEIYTSMFEPGRLAGAGDFQMNIDGKHVSMLGGCF